RLALKAPKGSVDATRALPKLTRETDVIHLHFSGVFRPWMTALSDARARLILTFQDYSHPELPANDPGMRKALARLAAKAAAVTAVSKSLAAALERDMPALAGRVSVVPNGWRPLPCAPPPPAPRPYVLSVGRLAPYKGTDVTIMAFSLLDRTDTDLVLCGAPFHRAHIEGLVKRLGLRGRVRLTGLKPQAEARALMKACLFHVSGARAETFGMANLEAMACGKAVVAPRVGGVVDYLRDGVNGLLVPPKNPGALADAMARLLDAPGLRARLGKRAADDARAYAWSAVAARYARLYL
ncbi:MAG: hypothetical protein COV48_15910, partial [Elusimicrobia bacterium CG11_big_fil_rev_8_21_14_0_20_64_6]